MPRDAPSTKNMCKLLADLQKNYPAIHKRRSSSGLKKMHSFYQGHWSKKKGSSKVVSQYNLHRVNCPSHNYLRLSPGQVRRVLAFCQLQIKNKDFSH